MSTTKGFSSLTGRMASGGVQSSAAVAFCPEPGKHSFIIQAGCVEISTPVVKGKKIRVDMRKSARGKANPVSSSMRKSARRVFASSELRKSAVGKANLPSIEISFVGYNNYYAQRSEVG